MGLILIYLLIGCIIAVPYTYLAGGSFENFFAAAWIAPVGATILGVILWVETKVTRMFWIVLTYFCLPIIFNGLSQLFGLFGYGEIKTILFDLRYAILGYIFITGLVFLILIGYVKSSLRRRRLRKRLEQRK